MHKSPAGVHYIYYGQTRTTAEQLAPGLDTRSVGGYVLLPGSQKASGSYQVSAERPIASAPSWIYKHLGQPKQKSETPTTPTAPLDLPINVSDAISYLLYDAPPAIEGRHGDNTTYQVAAAIRDRAISEETAITLLHKHYNHRCDPPWHADDIAEKVRNAYRYGQNAPGAAAPQAAFTPTGPVHPRPLHLETVMPKPLGWLLENRFCRGNVTLTFAAPGIGKSGFSLLEAAALVTGQPICPHSVISPAKKVLIYNTEESLSEIEIRLKSIFLAHNLDPQCAPGIHILSGHDRPLNLLSPDRHNGMRETDDVAFLAAAIQEHAYDLIILDPVISLHTCPENDNTAIDKLASILTRLSIKHDCAIHAIHHSRKLTPKEIPAGNMDIGRGASALAGRARIIHTLTTMTEKDAQTHNIPLRRRKYYIRVDQAKCNLGPPEEDAHWLEKTGYGDDNQRLVLRNAELAALHTGLHEDTRPIAEVLFSQMEPGEVWTLTYAAKIIREVAPNLCDGMKSDALRKKIARIFSTRQELMGKVIYYDVTKGRKKGGLCCATA
jgi:hypothetical protein